MKFKKLIKDDKNIRIDIENLMKKARADLTLKLSMIEIGDLTKHFDRFKDYGFEEGYDYPFTQPDVYSDELIDKMTIINVRDFLFS